MNSAAAAAAVRARPSAVWPSLHSIVVAVFASTAAVAAVVAVVAVAVVVAVVVMVPPHRCYPLQTKNPRKGQRTAKTLVGAAVEMAKDWSSISVIIACRFGRERCHRC